MTRVFLDSIDDLLCDDDAWHCDDLALIDGRWTAAGIARAEVRVTSPAQPVEINGVEFSMVPGVWYRYRNYGGAWGGPSLVCVGVDREPLREEGAGL